MTLGIDLWDPNHVTLTVDLLTAFLLGLVHGITPDEHTWPITFSYAVGGYSTRRGLFAGLIFSAAFTAQQALASELAHLGLARAHALQGHTDKSRAAYQDFFTLWKDADQDIPILKQAKAEYARLQ